jgi:hypothetical protein
MLNSNEMTSRQALLGCLILALTASTDQKAKMAGDLADEIAVGMSQTDVEKCQKFALGVQVASEDVFVAVASNDDKTCGIAEKFSGLRREYEADRDVFVFQTDANRTKFVNAVTGARAIGKEEAAGVLTTVFQLLIEKEDEEVAGDEPVTESTVENPVTALLLFHTISLSSRDKAYAEQAAGQAQEVIDANEFDEEVVASSIAMAKKLIDRHSKKFYIEVQLEDGSKSLVACATAENLKKGLKKFQAEYPGSVQISYQEAFPTLWNSIAEGRV